MDSTATTATLSSYWHRGLKQKVADITRLCQDLGFRSMTRNGVESLDFCMSMDWEEMSTDRRDQTLS